jgi:hypothetical protein
MASTIINLNIMASPSTVPIKNSDKSLGYFASPRSQKPFPVLKAKMGMRIVAFQEASVAKQQTKRKDFAESMQKIENVMTKPEDEWDNDSQTTLEWADANSLEWEDDDSYCFSEEEDSVSSDFDWEEETSESQVEEDELYSVEEPCAAFEAMALMRERNSIAPKHAFNTCIHPLRRETRSIAPKLEPGRPPHGHSGRITYNGIL